MNQTSSRYYLLTLGCPKNTVDSEGMAALLTGAGYRGVGAPADADMLIVNTCGFLAAAEEESLAALRELAKSKRRGQKLIAAGCMAQRAGERIVAEVPGVDGLLGTRRWMDVVPLVEGLRRNGRGERALGRYALLGDPEQAFAGATPRPVVTAGSAYLKISDGCNAPCAFCSIPLFKGKLRSRPQAAIVAEARSLVAAGAQELILIAQDVTDYGRDLGQPDALPGLLRAILAATSPPSPLSSQETSPPGPLSSQERGGGGEVSSREKGRADGAGLRWLRLMYAYPGHVSAALIETMASDPRICHYLDIPLQHGHPAVLRRMFRPSNVERQIETFAALRRAMPDMALRSTFIVGFPGETEEEFAGLLEFVEAIQFDKVGVFTFSPEPDTPACAMPNQVAAEVKAERYRRLMAAQQRISLARNQRQVGRTLAALVETHGEMQRSAALFSGGQPVSDAHAGPHRAARRPLSETVSLARSYRDAPEVDGLVIVPGALPIGRLTQVRITGALEYDLVGETIPNP